MADRKEMRELMRGVLDHLYETLKNGERPNKEWLKHDGALFGVPLPYWCVVWRELVSAGYVRGVHVGSPDAYIPDVRINQPSITLAGVDFLSE